MSGAPSISISWKRRAFKELAALPRPAQRRVVAAVERVVDEPLAGELLAAEWKGLRGLRVGQHRVIYTFDGRELLVLVVRVGHQREVYRAP